MKIFLLVFSSILLSCATPSPHKFDAAGVGKVDCSGVHVEACGLSLVGCGPSKAVEFNCLPAATYAGPGHWEPTVPADYAPEAQEDTK